MADDPDMIDTARLATELAALISTVTTMLVDLGNRGAPPMVIRPLEDARAHLEEALEESQLIYK